MKGLGSRIKELRKLRRLTLVDVAKKTGIDQATLSRIENEKMTGTLNSHTRIATALGLSLPELYRNALDSLSVTKEKKALRKFDIASKSSDVTTELLTEHILQKKMLPTLLKLKKDGQLNYEEYPAGSERFVYVVKGVVRLIYAGETKNLSAGESLYFAGSMSHSLKNIAKGESTLLSILTPASI
jgi:transcriptional regulator with XRE-family HTH domain